MNTKKKAHGRVNHAIKAGILTRPDSCEDCGHTPKEAKCWGGGRMSNMIAHHPNGYGTKEKDLTVVFVCRSCHGRRHNAN